VTGRKSIPATSRIARATQSRRRGSLIQLLKEIDMDDYAQSVTSWKCRLGRHTWLVVNDDNPEQRQNTHLECSRCSKVKDQTQFEHTKATWLSSGPGS